MKSVILVLLSFFMCFPLLAQNAKPEQWWRQVNEAFLENENIERHFRNQYYTLEEELFNALENEDYTSADEIRLQQKDLHKVLMSDLKTVRWPIEFEKYVELNMEHFRLIQEIAEASAENDIAIMLDLQNKDNHISCQAQRELIALYEKHNAAQEKIDDMKEFLEFCP